MDESLLLWGIVLIGVAALLLFLEIFVPSAGLIALLSIASALAGIICLWKYNPVWGALGGLVSLLGGPFIFIQGIKLWRHTPLGRKMVGEPTEEELEARRATEEKEAKELMALLGTEGEALTDLRPVGVVRINGKRYDALSETILIPAGSRVKVTVAEPAQIKVRPVDERRV
ncbi:MAG TPA: NfeD family protein [Phycisphaerales bacterium]|nr:NfeD family protein [Phycisphaerales bacterium]